MAAQLLLSILLTSVAANAHARSSPRPPLVTGVPSKEWPGAAALRYRGGENALTTFKERMQAAGPAGIVGVMPKAVDALLAGIGLAGSFAIMGALIATFYKDDFQYCDIACKGSKK